MEGLKRISELGCARPASYYINVRTLEESYIIGLKITGGAVYDRELFLSDERFRIQKRAAIDRASSR